MGVYRFNVLLVLAILGGLIGSVIAIGKQNFELHQLITQSLPLKIGDKAPIFKLKGLKGENINLKKLQEKNVLLFFFTSSCQDCKWEACYWERIYKRYKDKGFAMYGICSSDVISIKAFLVETPVSFPILLDSEGEVKYRYRLTRNPQAFLIAKNGKLVFIEENNMFVEYAVRQVNHLLGNG